MSNSATPWIAAHQAPLSMGFSRQEYWSGLPFPSPRGLPKPGIKPRPPALQADSLLSEPPGKNLGIWQGVPFYFLHLECFGHSWLFAISLRFQNQLYIFQTTVGSMVVITLNLCINLDRINIFMILIIQVMKMLNFPYLVKVVLVSLRKILSFSLNLRKFCCTFFRRHLQFLFMV